MRFLSRRISGDSLLSGVVLTKASMPPLNSIVRIAAADRRIRTGPSTSDNTEIVCRFGRKRRFVLMLEWLTLWPTWTPLPVTGHLRAMTTPLFNATETDRAASKPRGAGSRPWQRGGQAILFNAEKPLRRLGCFRRHSRRDR